MVGHSALHRLPRSFLLACLFFFPILSGCGSGGSASFTISPNTQSLDTNSGVQFAATSKDSGSTVAVNWSIASTNSTTGSGSIDDSGYYTPPTYLAADSVTVTVRAALQSNPDQQTTAKLTITPGFLNPLSPENVALSSSGTVSVTGTIAEVGGGSISFNTSNTSTGSSGGQGSVGSVTCSKGKSQYTSCQVTYTAPYSITGSTSDYIVAKANSSSSTTFAQVLLNSTGINSSPSTHQSAQSSTISLGSSGGNNGDYDSSNGSISYCCGGTLGSLVQDTSGNQYILSNNHVLAESDQATLGDQIVQPGLIDNSCSTTAGRAVANLTAYIPLSTTSTNVDAAIAKVIAGQVDANGKILELGSLSGGQLQPGAPVAGTGETASLNMSVAKSGRTTGLTCASIASTNTSIQVDYYTDCAETNFYVEKNYSGQIVVSGNGFSDSGDSGSLVVDTSNAQPVGLFYAGGIDNSGTDVGIANPIADVLTALSTSQHADTYTMVGGSAHSVACLNYGNGTVTAPATASTTSTNPASATTQAAVASARTLISSSKGIFGVATGHSLDDPTQEAVIVYVDRSAAASVPSTINGLRTVVIPTTQAAVESNNAPSHGAGTASFTLSADQLSAAAKVKDALVSSIYTDQAFFGVGVTQSYDNPAEAGLLVFVDRKKTPASKPATLNGLRVRYITMNRLHVTRSYNFAAHPSACEIRSSSNPAGQHEPFPLQRRGLKLK